MAGIDATNPLIIDVDATLITAYSEKSCAKQTFKNEFGQRRGRAAAPRRGYLRNRCDIRWAPSESTHQRSDERGQGRRQRGPGRKH